MTLLLIAGLVLFLLGSETLIRCASRLALALGLTPLVVGLTVVPLGTSAPALAISVDSALQGSTDIGLGKVVAQ